VANGPDVSGLVAGAQSGHPRSVARLISLIEDAAPAVPEITAALTSALRGSERRGWVIGLTGAPGVGKSTTTSALVSAFRARGSRVGVLAVDPSSPFTGGALLGDRVRMQEHATDPEVFIRSMATRGHLGGLAATTPQALRVLDVAGCDVELIETVGVGQSEVEIAGTADTTVVLLAPGMGDAVQAAKAGILEIGDVYVVNKADRDGADSTVRELRMTLTHGPAREAGAWRPPVVKTVASRGEGVDELVAELDRHHAWLSQTGEGDHRRQRRAAAELEALAASRYVEQLRVRVGPDGENLLTALARAVAANTLDPFTATTSLTPP
jgi:LAO/AO transport system kinase